MNHLHVGFALCEGPLRVEKAAYTVVILLSNDSSNRNFGLFMARANPTERSLPVIHEWREW